MDGKDESAAARGYLITLEGVEGCGKSTQARLLAEALRRAGKGVVLTREPGGDAVGEAIRGLLLDPANDVRPESEALLYAASRAQHVSKVIEPALRSGKSVVCDRYLDSSLAYQGFARGLGMEWILDLNLWATRGYVPDLTFVLDLAPEAGMARLGDRTRDRIEREDAAFHERVRQGFLAVAESFPERVVVLDASREPESLHGEIMRVLAERSLL